MSNRKGSRALSGSPFEPLVGICRARRLGETIAVSGTAPLGADGNTVAVGDVAEQTRRCIEIAQTALEEVGASLSDVFRTRIFLKHIEHWEAAARVHGEFFATIKPAGTIVQVSSFVDPDWLVEIEMDALASE